MYRVVGVGILLALLIGLALETPGQAWAHGVQECVAPGTTPVSVLEPPAERTISISQTPEFRVTWTCYTDVLWYQVRVYRQPDEPGAEWFIEYRYNPDTDNDWRRDHPSLMVTTGLLKANTDHWIVVTPMGPSEALLAEHTEGYLPTGLPMAYYVPLGPASEPLWIKIVE